MIDLFDNKGIVWQKAYSLFGTMAIFWWFVAVHFSISYKKIMFPSLSLMLNTRNLLSTMGETAVLDAFFFCHRWRRSRLGSRHSRRRLRGGTKKGKKRRLTWRVFFARCTSVFRTPLIRCQTWWRCECSLWSSSKLFQAGLNFIRGHRESVHIVHSWSSWSCIYIERNRERKRDKERERERANWGFSCWGDTYIRGVGKKCFNHLWIYPQVFCAYIWWFNCELYIVVFF